MLGVDTEYTTQTYTLSATIGWPENYKKIENYLKKTCDLTGLCKVTLNMDMAYSVALSDGVHLCWIVEVRLDFLNRDPELHNVIIEILD